MKFIRWQLLKLVEKTSDPIFKRNLPNSIAIIKLDEIGDYILFRNLIESISESESFRRFSITLIGNIKFKSLATHLDNEFISNYIWIDKNKFAFNYFYRYRILRRLKLYRYSKAVTPIFSRDTCFISEKVNRVITATQKVAFHSNKKECPDLPYTDLIKLPPSIIFEFDKNKYLIEQFIGQKLDISLPSMNYPTVSKIAIPKNYAVIFIGASRPCRNWSLYRFAKVAKVIRKEFGLQIVLCGGPGDIANARLFRKHFDSTYHDLVGKSSLLELLYILKHSQLVFSNETSAPHMAVALNCKNIFVVSNGDLFGRFTPYPADRCPKYHAIYPPNIMENLSDFEGLSRKYADQGSMDISGVTEQAVIRFLDENIEGFNHATCSP